MATPFTVFSGSNKTTLTNALLAPNSGVSVSNVTLNASGQNAVNFYDGSLAPLGISSGLLLTSGTTPGTSNTVSWFGDDNSYDPLTNTYNFDNGDADINAVVNTVFQTVSYDATTLSFDFVATDPTATSVSFDLVFGSDEYPEWVDQFVDCAVMLVNGVNYALFNHDVMHPLSVVTSNLTAGYFQDNSVDSTTGVSPLPIEYDGVSHVLKIVAPIQTGGVTNHIKIGIADTGDHVYDSGIFISNLSAGNIPGSGVVITPPNTGTIGDDTISGSAKDEYIDLKSGNDIAYAGAGDDIVVADAGNDTVYGGSGNDEVKGDDGDDSIDGNEGLDTAVYSFSHSDYDVAYDSAKANFSVTGKNSAIAEGKDTLSNVEFAKFSDGLFELNSTAGLVPVSSTVVTTPTNTAGVVLVTGIGTVGNTLTANVNDTDGISGSINYQWQSSTDGFNWYVIDGANSKTYTIGQNDAGTSIQVVVDYVDDKSNPENPISNAKSIVAASNKGLSVSLIELSAPIGASVKNPLTTLLQDAIDLGLTPNTAALAIKQVLNLPSNISLQNYDAYSTLLNNSTDNVALDVEKVAVEVAVVTSLSKDSTGIDLASFIVNAAQAGQKINLANANDLAEFLGLDITGLTSKTYPQPLKEIFDRNKNIAEASSLSSINKEWTDLVSIQDGIKSKSIADLTIHINQAPIGNASFALSEGLQDNPYLINASDLLQGFSDPDQDALHVSNLNAGNNGFIQDNNDGTYTFIPNFGYTGPVELTYSVIDGNGGEINASQLLVIAAQGNITFENNAPVLTNTSVSLADGLEDNVYVVSEADLLAGWTDVDGDGLFVTDLVSSNGTIDYISNADGSLNFVITPDANYNGVVNLTYGVVDGNGASVTASQHFNIAAVNDAPTGDVIITNNTDATRAITTAQQYDVLQASNTLADVDGLGTISYQWQRDGQSIQNANADVYSLTQDDVNHVISAIASYVDGSNIAESVSSAATQAIVNVNDVPTGSVVISGSAIQGQVLTASDSLADLDGLGLVTYQWKAGASIIGTGSSYALTQSDIGKAISVAASYVDGFNTIEAVNSKTTDLVIGINYAPIIALTTVNPAIATSTTVSYTGGIAFSDANTTDIHTNSVAAVGGVKGSLTANIQEISGTGMVNWSYNYTIPAVGLTILSKTDSFNVSVDDSHGGIATQNLAFNNIVGTKNADALNGTTGADILVGGAANDTLNGISGNDVLFGGLGNDSYIINNNTTVIVENAAEGTDLVTSSLDYTLGANLEKLTLSGTAISGTGNELANSIIGNASNNILTGGAGVDTLNGGAGDDTYIVNLKAAGTLEDAVTDASGIDTIKIANTYSGSVVTLTAASAIENFDISSSQSSLLNVTGNSSANILIGNDTANILTGLAGLDTLNGGASNDTLIGGAGNDVLTGGTGSDTFKFDTAKGASNIDTITDFQSGVDKLQFSKAAISSTNKLVVGQGTIPLFFNAVTSKVESLIYNSTTGQLSYDSDGNGTVAPVILETLASAPTLTASDIWIV